MLSGDEQGPRPRSPKLAGYAPSDQTRESSQTVPTPTLPECISFLNPIARDRDSRDDSSCSRRRRRTSIPGYSTAETTSSPGSLLSHHIGSVLGRSARRSTWSNTSRTVESLDLRSQAAIRPLTRVWVKCLFGRTRSRLAGRVARIHVPRVIGSRLFPKLLSYWNCQQSDYLKPFENFASFADMFSRAIRPEARPIRCTNPDSLVSPCDGVVAHLEMIPDLSAAPWLGQLKGAQYHVDVFVGEALSSEPVEPPCRWSPSRSSDADLSFVSADSSFCSIKELDGLLGSNNLSIARCAACGRKKKRPHFAASGTGMSGNISTTSGDGESRGDFCESDQDAWPLFAAAEQNQASASRNSASLPVSSATPSSAEVDQNLGCGDDPRGTSEATPRSPRPDPWPCPEESAEGEGKNLPNPPVTLPSSFEVSGAELVWFQAVIYLSPRNYHHFHSPCDWVISKRKHFTGEVMPVCSVLASRINNLFAVNERVVLTGSWRHGRFIYGAVAAYNVADIRLKFESDFVSNQSYPTGVCDTLRYSPSNLCYSQLCRKCAEIAEDLEIGKAVSRGEEIGEFRLGSTIILLFQAPRDFAWAVRVNDPLCVGQLLGQSRSYAL